MLLSRVDFKAARVFLARGGFNFLHGYVVLTRSILSVLVAFSANNRTTKRNTTCPITRIKVLTIAKLWISVPRTRRSLEAALASVMPILNSSLGCVPEASTSSDTGGPGEG